MSIQGRKYTQDQRSTQDQIPTKGQMSIEGQLKAEGQLTCVTFAEKVIAYTGAVTAVCLPFLTRAVFKCIYNLENYNEI